MRASISRSLYSQSFTNPDPGLPFPPHPTWTPQPSINSMIVPYLPCSAVSTCQNSQLGYTQQSTSFAPASGRRSTARENTHNSLGRFYFTFKCTDKWTASALPSNPATASSHPASLQDTLCPFSSLLQLFCPFPVWLSADDLIFLFTGQNRASEGSFPTTKLPDLRIHTFALPSLLLQISSHPCARVMPRSLPKPWTAFFLTYSRMCVCVCVYACVHVSCSVVSDALRPHGL